MHTELPILRLSDDGALSAHESRLLRQSEPSQQGLVARVAVQRLEVAVARYFQQRRISGVEGRSECCLARNAD